MYFHQLFTCPNCRDDPRVRRDSYCANCEKVTIYVSTKDARPYYLCRLCHPEPEVHDILASPKLLKSAKLSRGTAPSDPRGYALHLFLMHPPEFSEWFLNTYIKQTENRRNPALALELLKRWRPWLCDPEARIRFGTVYNSINEVYRSNGNELKDAELPTKKSRKEKESVFAKPKTPKSTAAVVEDIDLHTHDNEKHYGEPIQKTKLFSVSSPGTPSTRMSTRKAAKAAAVAISHDTNESDSLEDTYDSPTQENDYDEDMDGSAKAQKKKGGTSRRSTELANSPAPSVDDLLKHSNHVENESLHSPASRRSSIFDSSNIKLFATPNSSISTSSPAKPQSRKFKDENRKLRLELEHMKTYIQKITRKPIIDAAINEAKELRKVVEDLRRQVDLTGENVKFLSEAICRTNEDFADIPIEDATDVEQIKEELKKLRSENLLLKASKKREEEQRLAMELQLKEVQEGLSNLVKAASTVGENGDGVGEFKAAINEILVNETLSFDGLRKRKRSLSIDVSPETKKVIVLYAPEISSLNEPQQSPTPPPTTSDETTVISDDLDSLQLDIDLDIDDMEVGGYDPISLQCDTRGTFFVMNEPVSRPESMDKIDADLPSSVVVPLFE